MVTDNAGENIKAFRMDQFCSTEDDPQTDEESSDEEVMPDTSTNEDLSDFVVETDDTSFTDAVDDLQHWTDGPLKRLGCVTHALQLVVKECMKKNPETSKIMKRLDALISFFTRAPAWHRKLMNLTKKGLIKIGATRWNGFLLSLNRILEVLVAAQF